VAFYSQVTDDRFESTENTRGPWDPGAQHAGPPAALLGRAVEKMAEKLGREDMRIARLTYEISRPVPIAPLTVTSAVKREGRSVVLIEAAIEPYMWCNALLIRTMQEAAPATSEPPPAFDTAATKPFFATGATVGYHTSMEVRFAEGGFTERGPATAWMRPRIPLVDGEPFSPLGRVLVAADSGNGVSNVLDIREHIFVNPDLTVHLFRYPMGDWVCLKAVTSIDGDGIGLADTALYDERGRIGRGVQSLFVNPRGK
jgi:hypothetical protein